MIQSLPCGARIKSSQSTSGLRVSKGSTCVCLNPEARLRLEGAVKDGVWGLFPQLGIEGSWRRDMEAIEMDVRMVPLTYSHLQSSNSMMD